MSDRLFELSSVDPRDPNGIFHDTRHCSPLVVPPSVTRKESRGRGWQLNRGKGTFSEFHGLLRAISEVSPPLTVNMAIGNIGSLVLNLMIFTTTLVNFTYALNSLESLILVGLYVVSKIFAAQPEAKCSMLLCPDG